MKKSHKTVRMKARLDTETLVGRLTQLRMKHGMTQEDVAKKLGINRSTYTYMESGMTALGIKYLITLSDLYGVTIDYLVRGTK